MSVIAINVNSQQGYHEINISGTAVEFANLAEYLTNLSTGVLSLKNDSNPFFPISMDQLLIELVDQSDGRITAQVTDKDFKLLGDTQAFRKLIDFLESLPNLSPGEHFHLDWFANEDLLAPSTSNMTFIFSMKA
jgi:hypothetical protein